MSDLRTNADVMRVSGAKALETAEQMKATLVRLAGTVEGASASWAGSAHNTFNDVMDRFNAAMNKVQVSLVEISDNIKSNAVGYEGAEDEATQGLAGVAGALNM